jgi:hypothetical protein
MASTPNIIKATARITAILSTERQKNTTRIAQITINTDILASIDSASEEDAVRAGRTMGADTAMSDAGV